MNPYLLNSFLTLAVGTLSVFVLVAGRPVILPFVVALFLTFLLNAIAENLEKWGLKTTILRYTLAFIVLTLFLLFPLFLVSNTIPDIIQAAPEYEKNLDTLGSKYFEQVPGGRFIEKALSNIDLTNIVSSLASGVASFASEVVVVIVYVCFILAEQASFERRIAGVLRQDHNRIKKILGSIAQKVKIYLKVKTLASLLIGVITYIALEFFGVNFAAFWAVICFFLNFIPSIGSLLGIILPSLMAVVQFENLTPFFVVLFVVGTAQLSISNVLEPKMMGHSLNMSPLAIILALFTFAAIWGIVGAFLSVPLLVIVILIADEFESTKPYARFLSDY